MKVIQQQFRVSYQYPVYFTTALFNNNNELFRNFLKENSHQEGKRKVLFVLDAGLLSHHPRLKNEIEEYLQTISQVSLVTPFLVIPGGEEAKNNEKYFKEIVAAINEQGIDRHSFIVAVGGGSVLDTVGYAASIAHRGIRHIRIPTTVLSQNDSGVGVKNGINFFGKKNFLGTFSPPFAVFNDINFLDTLDDRNWHSGIAEAIKVALIKDKEFFKWLEGHADALLARDKAAMEYLIFHCAELHLQHIASGDPFENGSSRPLDFGHWSAHKLEQLTDFSLTHGEAVAIGMALDVLYSEKIGWLEISETKRVLSLLKGFKFDLYHPFLEKNELLDGLTEFREHLGGELTIMLLKEIGKGENIHEMDPVMIKQCIEYLNESR